MRKSPLSSPTRWLLPTPCGTCVGREAKGWWDAGPPQPLFQTIGHLLFGATFGFSHRAPCKMQLNRLGVKTAHTPGGEGDLGSAL